MDTVAAPKIKQGKAMWLFKNTRKETNLRQERIKSCFLTDGGEKLMVVHRYMARKHETKNNLHIKLLHSCI